jgi:PAS domain S-box-containing protein
MHAMHLSHAWRSGLAYALFIGVWTAFSASVLTATIHQSETRLALQIGSNAVAILIMTQVVAYWERRAQAGNEHAQAEEALLEERNLLRTLIDNSPDYIFAKDSKGRFLVSNVAHARAGGALKPDELIGKTASECFPPVLASQFDADDQIVLESGAALINLERETVDSTGSQRHVLTTKVPLRDRSGNIYGLAGVTRDITERKRVQETIERHAGELAALNAIMAALSRTLELPLAMETLKKLLAEQLDITGGALFLQDDADPLLRLETSWELSASVLAEIRRGLAVSGLDGPAASRQAAPPTPDIRFDLNLNLDVVRAKWPSALYIPFRLGEAMRGVLCLFSCLPGAFTTDQLPFFETLREQVGVAIQNARLFAQVSAGRERLQALSHRLADMQEAERRRIAVELHDEIGQSLTGLRLTLEASMRSLPDAASANLDQAHTIVQSLIRQVHDLSLDLRPAALDNLGLPTALLVLFERYTAQTRVHVDFYDRTCLDGRLPLSVETAAYRIVQESLTNVARHARTDRVAVFTWCEQDKLIVQVEDQGVGFDLKSVKAENSTGLAGMQERAISLGGRLEVVTALGMGTRLVAELPVSRAAEKGNRDDHDYAR